MRLTKEQSLHLCRVVQTYLADNNVSKTSFAKTTGIADSRITDWTKGKTQKVMQDETAKKLEAALGMKLKDILGSDPVPSYTSTKQAAKFRANGVRSHLPIPVGERAPRLVMEGEVIPRAKRNKVERIEIAREFMATVRAILSA